MDDEGRRCALPGCEVGIRSTHGRPERRYCTPGHRAAARRARRAAGQALRAAAATGDLASTWVCVPVDAASGVAGILPGGYVVIARAQPSGALVTARCRACPPTVDPAEGTTPADGPDATVTALDERRDLRLRRRARYGSSAQEGPSHPHHRGRAW